MDMTSRIAEAIKLNREPVAVYRTANPPENAVRFKAGTWGCVISLLNAASKGKTAVCSHDTGGCRGGRAGVGIEPLALGTIEFFLSVGGRGPKPGEFYKKSPALAADYINSLSDWKTEDSIVFQPLSEVGDDVAIDGVVFLCNMDQLSGLITLANYDNNAQDNVRVVFGSGCSQSILRPFSDDGKTCYIGLTDPSSRKFIEKDLASFTIPFKRFLDMEKEVEGSFLTKDTWSIIQKRI